MEFIVAWCDGCQKLLLMTGFSKRKDSKTGYRGRCKTCVAKNKKAYAKKHYEKLKVWRKEYYSDNKGRIKAEQRDYYQKTKNKQREYHRQHYKKNKDKLLPQKQEYRRNNKEKAKESRRRNAVEHQRKRKEASKALCKSRYYRSALPPDVEARMVGGFVTVVCKMCGNRFIPTTRQCKERVSSFKYIDRGEHNLYCSEECKNSCPIFNYKPNARDPRLPQPDNDPRACQTNHLKQIQCDETEGQSYCEKCGDFIDVDLHHTLPVAQYVKESISSAGHILLCWRCHQEVDHSKC